ncbi:glycosyltransferase family 4 protein [Pseudoalteromonas sp. SSM20]|uniref:glycosyltransferase family 4 protein n=1 Tax=Pseudoalteromonas sp. SSM20 TaxID=3139394 RepID=UPI003BAD72C9
MNKKRLRVLLIAELCDPNLVSVPLVAWSHSQALRKVADVHIVTQIRHRKSFLDAGLIEGKDFTVINTEHVFKYINYLRKLLIKEGTGWTTGMALQLPAYLEFERLVWKQFKDKLKANEFDIVHRLTPLSPTLPSFIAKRCNKINIPFIWGPIAGGLPWPKAYDQERKKEREWLAPMRDLYKYLPYYKSSRQSASALVIASQATLEQVPMSYRDKCIYLPENAIDPLRFNDVKTSFYQAGEKLKLVFVGRLVPYKCVDVVLHACKKLVLEGKVCIDILGDGPERETLEKLSYSLGLSDGVTFHGNVKHQSVQTILKSNDVLIFPSIREFGGGVVLEAMALGVVPMVVNYGGPAELVNCKTGVRIDLAPKNELALAFESALESLLAEPEKIEVMGRESITYVNKCFTWDAKAKMMQCVYEWVLNKQLAKPDFGCPLQ